MNDYEPCPDCRCLMRDHWYTKDIVRACVGTLHRDGSTEPCALTMGWKREQAA